MIIFGSRAFIERFDCTVSWPDQKPVQGRAMDAWSGELLKVYRAGQAAVMMHDASLAAIIVPLKGVRSFEGVSSHLFTEGCGNAGVAWQDI